MPTASTVTRPAPAKPIRAKRERTIRVAIVDDHPAVRAGLESVVERERDLTCVASVGSAAHAIQAAESAAPDVVVLDYQLGTTNGLVLARSLKELPGTRAVLIYSAYADARLGVLAIVAGAEGILSKATRGADVCDAIRSIASGGRVFPRISPEALSTLGRQLDPDDLAVLGMLVHGTPPAEIAQVLGISERWLDARRWSMIRRLETGGLVPRGRGRARRR